MCWAARKVRCGGCTGCGWWRWGCSCAPPHQTYGLPLENRSPVLTGLLIAVLCVFALGAGVLAGLFSVNADKAVETAASRIHGVGSVLGFLALAFAPLLVALLAFREGAGGAGVFSLVCFALDVCCFTLFVMADKEAWRGTWLAQEGTWQRLTLLFMYLPLALLTAAQLIQK